MRPESRNQRSGHVPQLVEEQVCRDADEERYADPARQQKPQQHREQHRMTEGPRPADQPQLGAAPPRREHEDVIKRLVDRVGEQRADQQPRELFRPYAARGEEAADPEMPEDEQRAWLVRTPAFRRTCRRRL